ncbi:hypothetical protein ZEAMMB73_Zm00001d007021 [Zea mays]|uniref:Uncharacterized protein n=1 Tax=Zea mays TaxID=4577 RepID=A0A1D6F2A8_MAIZE|nr:hypothetical protein ZEAMMB73_Zm00001d007021 [Zea mays]
MLFFFILFISGCTSCTLLLNDPVCLQRTLYNFLPRWKSFVLFDDIQDVNNLPQVKSAFAKVVVKFPRRRNSQHYILQDITGSKIEAISNVNNVQRFDALLTQGCTYTLYRVAFCLNREELQFRNIGHGLELGLITHTIVDPFTKPIQFPPFPKYLMPFHEVYQQQHKTFIDVIGIVLHLEPLKHIGGRPYREAVLMDSRWDLIIVGVWTDLLQRNDLRWSLARVDKNIIIGTLLRCNHNHSNVFCA